VGRPGAGGGERAAVAGEYEIDFVVLARFMKILSQTSSGVTRTRLSTSIPRCFQFPGTPSLPAGLRARRQDHWRLGSFCDHAPG
jgi:hypothetical protein